jgi:hypothetical protein
MYSCALWDEPENGVRGDLTVGPTPGDLEAAQQRKIMHLLGKARLRPGDKVLEFGTGWGALAIQVGFGCHTPIMSFSNTIYYHGFREIRRLYLAARWNQLLSLKSKWTLPSNEHAKQECRIACAFSSVTIAGCRLRSSILLTRLSQAR